ncbi:MAG: FtsX-like permease family protein, partial [Prevotella sp.]|nr:FtsX-like permease family protein [Prevotella sp.]
ILGSNLLLQLGLPANFSSPIQVYAPRKGEKIDLADPRESLNQDELYSPKVGFMVKQNKYDSNYVITNIGFTRRLFEQQGKVSAIELRLNEGADLAAVKSQMQKTLGENYKVLDRYEQQEDTFKIMQIEKLISYIFLTFILMIACFNIIGSLSMLIIDKKQDAITLRNLGASDKQISSIFMIEGRMICLLGAVIGIAVGLALCYVQQEYGLIRFGNSEGNYI